MFDVELKLWMKGWLLVGLLFLLVLKVMLGIVCSVLSRVVVVVCLIICWEIMLIDLGVFSSGVVNLDDCGCMCFLCILMLFSLVVCCGLVFVLVLVWVRVGVVMVSSRVDDSGVGWMVMGFFGDVDRGWNRWSVVVGGCGVGR